MTDAVEQVRRVAEENGVDVSSQIQELEHRAQQVQRVAVILDQPGCTVCIWHSLEPLRLICPKKSLCCHHIRSFFQ